MAVHREAAARALRQATDARLVSQEIGSQEACLRERLAPVLQHHTSDVWASLAADQSRIRLRSLHGAALAAVGDDLFQVRAALERRAEELEQQARDAQRQADQLESVSGGFA